MRAWPRVITSAAQLTSLDHEGPRGQLQVWECQNCKHTVILLELTLVSGDETAVEQMWLWPPLVPEELDASIPESVRSLMLEASICANAGALRAAAGMYRAAVEKVCDERQVAPGKLYHRLKGLKADKGVDGDLVEHLHEARALGNYSLHEGMEFSPAEVADVASLITEALVLLYVQPAQRAAMRAARRAREQGSP